jgi:hypothetical protein
MPPHINDAELAGIVREGGKIVERRPAPGQEPKAPSELQQILAAIRSLDGTLSALAERPVPEVKVAAPQVSVKAPVTVEASKPPRRWRVEVTERDNSADQRIKSLTIEAID